MVFCSLADGVLIWSLKDWVETPGRAGDTNTVLKFHRLDNQNLYLFSVHSNIPFTTDADSVHALEALSRPNARFPFEIDFASETKNTINVSIIRHKWGHCTRALLPLRAGRLAKCFAFLQQLNKSFKPRKDFLLSHGYNFQRVSDTLGLQHTKIFKPECARHQRLEEEKQFSRLSMEKKVS